MPYTFHRPANGQTYTVAVPDDLYQLGMSDQFARQMVECVGLLISEAHIAGQGSMKPMLEEMQRTLAERTAERDLSSAAHKADIARIGEVMMEAAVDNDFCEDFDDYVDHLNDHLAYKLPTRKSDYIVRRTYKECQWVADFWADVDRRLIDLVGFDTNDGIDRDRWGVYEEFYGCTPTEAAAQYVRERYSSIESIREELLG